MYLILRFRSKPLLLMKLRVGFRENCFGLSQFHNTNFHRALEKNSRSISYRRCVLLLASSETLFRKQSVKHEKRAATLLVILVVVVSFHQFFSSVSAQFCAKSHVELFQRVKLCSRQASNCLQLASHFLLNHPLFFLFHLLLVQFHHCILFPLCFLFRCFLVDILGTAAPSCCFPFFCAGSALMLLFAFRS